MGKRGPDESRGDVAKKLRRLEVIEDVLTQELGENLTAITNALQLRANLQSELRDLKAGRHE